MVSGGSIVDTAMLIVAANVDCPQPSTKSHTIAMGFRKLENIIVVQNKVDIAMQNDGQV
jgi:translation initiation factor 2 subunit 3